MLQGVTMKNILSLSGGKDSVAMLLFVLKNLDKYPLDEVIFVDTGWEFNSIYKVIEKCNELFPITTIKIDLDAKFDNYSWCGGRARWGTTYKLQAINKYYKKKYPNDIIVEYIGYAKGEEKRINHSKKIVLYPLIENGISENDALVMCYKSHIHWIEYNGEELYDFLDRVSCKYCKNKNLKELEELYTHFPKYWNELREKQLTTDRQYRNDYDFEELEQKFNKEEKQIKMKEVL